MFQRMSKKLTAAALVLCLCAAMLVPAGAYDAETAQSKAEALQAMNLFKGSDNGFELDRAPTRMEALIMLIRLLGQENEALYGEGYSHPFTDAPGWENAGQYLAYGYTQHLTTGATAATFEPEAPASAQMYATFILRALGYEDSEQGTVWDNWDSLLRAAVDLPQDVDLTNFRRGDMVSISYAALDADVQGEDVTLAEKLVADGALSSLSLRVGRVVAGQQVTKDSPISDIMAYLYASVTDEISVQHVYEEEVNSDNVEGYLGTDKVAFTEGLAVEPMMTAQAHSVCLIRLPEGADVEEAKTLIRENVNPRKWICVGVSPENVYVENIGNLVLLAMDNSVGGTIAGAFRALDTSLVSPDANGMMKVGETYIQQPDPMNRESLVRFAEKLTSLREQYFPENDAWYAVIPDKSFYARDSIAYSLDHDAMTAGLKEYLYDWNSIELSDTLALDEYYLTDPHWKQEDILDTVGAIGAQMGFSIDEKAFTAHTYDSFIGSYSRLVPGIEAETLTWLTSKYTDAAKVSNTQTPDATMVYNTDMLTGDSAYNVFLSGLSPLTVIESPQAARDKSLVLFSDSYAASIAPLLLEQYSTITIVDLRYILSSMLDDYVDFDGADILFLYSAEMVNHSSLLK